MNDSSRDRGPKIPRKRRVPRPSITEAERPQASNPKRAGAEMTIVVRVVRIYQAKVEKIEPLSRFTIYAGESFTMRLNRGSRRELRLVSYVSMNEERVPGKRDQPIPFVGRNGSNLRKRLSDVARSNLSRQQAARHGIMSRAHLNADYTRRFDVQFCQNLVIKPVDVHTEQVETRRADEKLTERDVFADACMHGTHRRVIGICALQLCETIGFRLNQDSPPAAQNK